MLQCEINVNLFFSNCIFIGKVSSEGTYKTLPVHSCFKNNLVFFACDFRDEVDFSNSVVFGMVNFNKSIFSEKTSFNNMVAWSKDSYFSEIKAEKEFSMVYASFLGNLYFMDARSAVDSGGASLCSFDFDDVIDLDFVHHLIFFDSFNSIDLT